MKDDKEYKEKFQRLFQETTRAIHMLRDIQQECIQAYISVVEEHLDEMDGHR